MTRRFWRYLLGYVDIEIAVGRSTPGPSQGTADTAEGSAAPQPLAPELADFLNRAAAAGLTLWRARRQGDVIVASIALGDVPGLRQLVRTTPCRVRFRGRHGWPFAWRRLRRRRLLWVGAAVAALVVYYLAGCIWFIEIHGLERLSEAALRHELARAGLRPGVRKSSVDLRLLAERLPLEVPGVAWAGITSYGVKVVVEVVEKLPAPQALDEGPAHVVARRPGVVVEVLVLHGVPVVQPGQLVRPGQILIRGEYGGQVPPGAGRRPGSGTPRPRGVGARGRVLARTWYSQYHEVPLLQTQAARTGRSHVQVVLRMGSWRLPLYWQRGRPSRYELRRETLLAVPWWRDDPPLVEVVRETRHEIVLSRRTLDPRQAVTEAERWMLARVAGSLPPGSRVVAVQSRVVQRGASFVGVRTTVEVIEDIGVRRPLAGAAEP